jgi:anthranilate synthase component 1
VAAPADGGGTGGGLPVSPSLDEVRELARDYNVVSLRHTFIDDCETPVSAFLKLRGKTPQSPGFLLESAEQGQRVGRYSFIGVRPRSVLRWSLGDEGDPYALAAEEVARFRQAPLPDLPPFAGGAVGYFGYDLVRTVETTLGEPNPDAVGLPDMALMLSDVLVVFDHLKHTITILVNVYAGDLGEVEESYADARATIEKARRLLAGPVPGAQDGSLHPPRDVPLFNSNLERSEFEAMVARIVEYVHAGDAFQVVPSQRWSADLDVDPFSVYRGLRVVNPSPYMYYLDYLDFQVAGASPEPLLTVSGRRVSTRPIAGTRPRGASPEEDARIAEGLLEDEKERSEHVMLVDLGRNDLGRVCEYGSVHVDSFMIVETYSHVMHIVSNVSGTLRPEIGAMDALRSVLPAGTLSGAPKVRAMEIIDELEPVKRGGYGGAIGWLSYTGDLDTCIHIRTVVMKDGRAHIQAGGGTVADAVPAYEYEESVNKAKGVKAAIELAARQPDWP